VAHVTTTRSALGMEETQRWLEAGTLVVRRTFVPTGDGSAVQLSSCEERFVVDASPPSFAATKAEAKAAPAAAVVEKAAVVKATGAPVAQYERVPGQAYEFVSMRNEKGFLEVRRRRALTRGVMRYRVGEDKRRRHRVSGRANTRGWVCRGSALPVRVDANSSTLSLSIRTPADDASLYGWFYSMCALAASECV
jgi:hypothetical protein